MPACERMSSQGSPADSPSCRTFGEPPPAQVTAGLHTQAGQSLRAAHTTRAVPTEERDSAQKEVIACIDLAL